MGAPESIERGPTERLPVTGGRLPRRVVLRRRSAADHRSWHQPSRWTGAHFWAGTLTISAGGLHRVHSITW